MIDLKEADRSDLNLLVNLHMDSYPSYLFTSKFSRKMLMDFYGKQIKYARCSYVMTLNDNAVGVVMGSENADRARSEFIRENLASILLVLLRNPAIFIKKLHSVLARKEKYISVYTFRLLNILTSKKALNRLESEEYIRIPKGLTSLGLSLFEDKLKELGIESYGLSVDRSNLIAINFYLKSEFRIEKIIGDSVFMYKTLIKNTVS